MSDIHVAPVVRGMLPEIGGLFETAFHRPFSCELYLWRFLHNPFGPPMALVAVDGDRIVAHYGVCPILVRTVDGGSILGALSMTTMTHPAYQGRGLFPRMAEQLYGEILHEHDCRLVFGFPNPNSHYSITRRLGWRDVHALFFMAAQLGGPSSSDHGFRLLGWQALAGILRAHEREIRFYQPCARSPEFVAWRYAQNPVRRYTALAPTGASEPETAVIVKEHVAEDGSRSLDIVDVLGAHHEDALHAAVTAALAYGRSRRLTRAQAWVDLHHPAFAVLERLRMQPTGPIRYFGVRWLSDAPADGVEPTAWRITMGDSDVF